MDVDRHLLRVHHTSRVLVDAVVHVHRCVQKDPLRPTSKEEPTPRRGPRFFVGRCAGHGHARREDGGEGRELATQNRGCLLMRRMCVLFICFPRGKRARARAEVLVNTSEYWYSPLKEVEDYPTQPGSSPHLLLGSSLPDPSLLLFHLPHFRLRLRPR